MINHTTEGSGPLTPRLSKLANILKVFYRGQSLNRFEAEHHHDHCLNTTVSILQNGYGIQIDRKRERVPCLNRRAWTSVNRYWLSGTDENKKRAYALLSQWGQA